MQPDGATPRPWLRRMGCPLADRLTPSDVEQLTRGSLRHVWAWLQEHVRPASEIEEMKQNVALATTSEPREPERQALHELQEQVREALASGALLRERLRAVEAEIESGVADLCGAAADMGTASRHNGDLRARRVLLHAFSDRIEFASRLINELSQRVQRVSGLQRLEQPAGAAARTDAAAAARRSVAAAARHILWRTAGQLADGQAVLEVAGDAIGDDAEATYVADEEVAEQWSHGRLGERLGALPGDAVEEVAAGLAAEARRALDAEASRLETEDGAVATVKAGGADGTAESDASSVLAQLKERRTRHLQDYAGALGATRDALREAQEAQLSARDLVCAGLVARDSLPSPAVADAGRPGVDGASVDRLLDCQLRAAAAHASASALEGEGERLEQQCSAQREGNEEASRLLHRVTHFADTAKCRQRLIAALLRKNRELGRRLAAARDELQREAKHGFTGEAVGPRSETAAALRESLHREAAGARDGVPLAPLRRCPSAAHTDSAAIPSDGTRAMTVWRAVDGDGRIEVLATAAGAPRRCSAERMASGVEALVVRAWQGLSPLRPLRRHTVPLHGAHQDAWVQSQGGGGAAGEEEPSSGDECVAAGGRTPPSQPMTVSLRRAAALFGGYAPRTSEPEAAAAAVASCERELAAVEGDLGGTAPSPAGLGARVDSVVYRAMQVLKADAEWSHQKAAEAREVDTRAEEALHVARNEVAPALDQWWEQPAQHCTPHLRRQGSTLREWAQRWRSLAHQLRAAK